jgi:hypothetical protein
LLRGLLVWSCFERHVPIRFSHGGRKLPWITGKLSCLNNKKTKAAKRSKASKKRCLEDETIDDCECKQLRGELLSLRGKYQLMHGWDGRTYDDFPVGIEEAIKCDPKIFFGYVDLKKKRVKYPSVIDFEVLCHLVLMTSAIFLLILYNEHMLMMYVCLLIPNQIWCRMILVLFSVL